MLAPHGGTPFYQRRDIARHQLRRGCTPNPLNILLGDAVGAARPRNYRLCSCESWEMKIASGKWRRDP